MPNVYLEVLGRQTNLRRIALKSSITVGRQKGCKLRIPSRAISRQHCRIELTNGHVSITDLASSNGTWLNGERLQPHSATVVEDASKLAIGNEKFRVIVQPTENLDATVVDQDLFSAAAVADVDLGATIVETTSATEPEVDLLTVEDVEAEQADMSDVTPIEDDVVPVQEDVVAIASDVSTSNDDIAIALDSVSVDQPPEEAGELDVDRLEEFDLLADDHDPEMEIEADHTTGEESQIADGDVAVLAESEAAQDAATGEPISIEPDAVADLADTEDLVAEVEVLDVLETNTEAAGIAEEAGIEPIAEVTEEIEAEPAEAVQGSLFEFVEDESDRVDEISEALDVLDAPTHDGTETTAESSCDNITVDADDNFGVGVDEVTQTEAAPVAEETQQQECDSVDAVRESDAEIVAVETDTEPAAVVDHSPEVDEAQTEVADVTEDEFVAIVEDDATESLEFLVEEETITDVVANATVEVDAIEPEAADSVELVEAELVDDQPEDSAFAFMQDDDHIDAEQLHDAVAEAVAVDESASVLNESVPGNSVLDLDEDDLPVAEYVGDDEIPVAALVDDADDDIPAAIEIEEVDEVAAAIIESDEEESEVIIAEQAEESVDDAEFELVAEEHDEFAAVHEADSSDADPLASTMMMTQEMQAFDPHSADTGFSLGDAVSEDDVADTAVEQIDEVVAVDEPVDDDNAIAVVEADIESETEDDVTEIIEAEVGPPDDDSDVVPVAETEPPRKKGGLFGWLNIFKRKKRPETEPQIIDDLDDNESTDPDVVEEIAVVDEAEVTTQLISDDEAIATFVDDDDATVVEAISDLDGDGATSEFDSVDEMDLVEEIDDEDEELTAVDRSQFVDPAADPVADGSDEDDAMDFLSGADDAEDMAASFLGENEATAKTDDSDFEDFFADIKD